MNADDIEIIDFWVDDPKLVDIRNAELMTFIQPDHPKKKFEAKAAPARSKLSTAKPTNQDPAKLTSNLQQHPKGNGETFNCPICNKIFLRKMSVERHLLAHTGEKPHICSWCSKGFFQKNDLKRHITMHTGEMNFECNHCSRRFNTQKNLKYHMNSHSLKRPYKCQHCGEIFNVKRNFIQHESLHNPEKRWKCAQCEKRFGSKATLRSHEQTHSNVSSYKCATCPMSFKRLFELNAHMRQQHEDGRKSETTKPTIFDHLPTSKGASTSYGDNTTTDEEDNDDSDSSIKEVRIKTEIFELSD